MIEERRRLVQLVALSPSGRVREGAREVAEEIGAEVDEIVKDAEVLGAVAKEPVEARDVEMIAEAVGRGLLLLSRRCCA